MFIYRVQELKDLGELSPHWDNLRKEVMARYGGVISCYQETLAELDKITGTTAQHPHLHPLILSGGFLQAGTQPERPWFVQLYLQVEKRNVFLPFFSLSFLDLGRSEEPACAVVQ